MNDTNGVLFSFGLVADIQYADIEDRFIVNYNNETTCRRYRNSLECLRKAVSCWKGIKFVAQLGDIIDGFNSEQGKSREALQSVLTELDKLPPHISLVNVLGNHELDNFSRTELATISLYPESSSRAQTEQDTKDRSKFNNLAESSSVQVEEPAFYFAFSPHRRFRVVVLDTHDITILGRNETSTQDKKAFRLLTQRNKNEDLEDPSGLQGADKRFVSTNGGVGARQLLWLETILAAAVTESQKVIIFSHVPFHPQSCDAVHLLWNYQEVLDVLWKYDCVVSCFYGHGHGASHVVDGHGIQYCMVETMVETPLGSNCFAAVHVKEDCLLFEGHGKQEMQIFKF